MRDYTGVPVHVVQNAEERVNVIGPIDYYLRDLSRAMSRISKGEVPDGSGTTIIAASPLSDIYLVLAGRIAPQVAHGGKLPSSTLTLASTTHATKGKVFLGNAQQTTYDETNERIGVAEPSPDAKVHITVGAASNQFGRPEPTSNGANWAGSDGTGSGADISHLIDEVTPDNSDYARISDAFNSSLDVVYTTVTDPGINSGHTISVRVAKTGGVSGTSSDQFQFAVKVGLATIVSYNTGASLTTTPTTFSYTLSSAEVTTLRATGLNYADLGVQISYSSSTSAGANDFRVYWAQFEVPAIGGILGDTLQKWENPTQNNTLSYVTDSLGNTVLAAIGAPHVAVQASGFDLTIGSPASGMVWSSTNTVGAGTWASASSLATKLQHRWVANGPYRVDGDVDGAWITPRAGTLSLVRFYRREGGSSGSTAVELLKNGTTVFSAPPNISATAGASATASGTLSVTTFAANDRFTVSASAVDVGRPRDWVLMVEAY